jgi:hypothetical protein
MREEQPPLIYDKDGQRIEMWKSHLRLYWKEGKLTQDQRQNGKPLVLACIVGGWLPRYIAIANGLAKDRTRRPYVESTEPSKPISQFELQAALVKRARDECIVRIIALSGKGRSEVMHFVDRWLAIRDPAKSRRAVEEFIPPSLEEWRSGESANNRLIPRISGFAPETDRAGQAFLLLSDLRGEQNRLNTMQAGKNAQIESLRSQLQLATRSEAD